MRIQNIIANTQCLSLTNQGLSALFSFASLLILTRILGLKNYGEWTLMITIFIFFDMFRTGTLHSSLMYFGTGTYVKKALSSCWIIGILFSAFSLLLVSFIYVQDQTLIQNHGLILLAKWFPFLVIGSLPFNIAIWVSQLNLNFKRILFIMTIL